MARPTIYTMELGEAICERLAGGDSLRSICRDDEMPALSSVLLWVVDGKHAEFSEQYARARDANGQSHGDRVADLVDKVINGQLGPQEAKVAMDGLKWSAERMAPKSYGNKQQLEHTGKDGAPIKIENKSPREMAREILFALEYAKREEGKTTRDSNSKKQS
jgi:hypothetical protein